MKWKIIAALLVGFIDIVIVYFAWNEVLVPLFHLPFLGFWRAFLLCAAIGVVGSRIGRIKIRIAE